jgi:hypothetical protein
MNWPRKNLHTCKQSPRMAKTASFSAWLLITKQTADKRAIIVADQTERSEKGGARGEEYL